MELIIIEKKQHYRKWPIADNRAKVHSANSVSEIDNFDAEFIFNHAGGRVPSVLLSTHDVAVVHLEVKIMYHNYYHIE